MTHSQNLVFKKFAKPQRFMVEKVKVIQVIMWWWWWWNGTNYSRKGWVKFMEDSLLKIWSVWSALCRPYPFKFCKGCLPQILLSPFLNTLSQILVVWFCDGKFDRF